MHLLTIAVSAAIIIVVSAINLSSRMMTKTQKGQPEVVESEVVLSETDEAEEKTPTPDATPNPTSSPTPSPVPQPQPVVITGFVYPGSTSIGGNAYTSAEEPKVITDWYKERIKTEGFNVRTAVSTTTNGKVLNKLEAADGERTIHIEISREPGETLTTITISEE